jgi:hypothetical protein
MSARDDLWELQVRLLLSIQRALLGEVTPNIRAVTAQIGSDTVTLRWIIDGVISDSLRRDLSAVGTEVIADFATHQIAEEFVRCDAPSALDELLLDHLAYLRRE